MIGIMNKNQLTIQSKFGEPPIIKINSIIDNCYRDCQNNYFLTFKNYCV